MKSARATWLRIGVLAVLAVVLSACGGARARYESHLQRGKQYLDQGNLDKAGVEFRNALQIQPKDADALFFNGLVADRRGDIRLAAGYYQGALEVRPVFPRARARLGRALVFGGAAKLALEVAKPGLAATPDDPDLLAVRAAANHQLGDDEAARVDAEHAVRIAPANENAVGVLAALYAKAGDSARALTLVSDAVQRAPGSVELRGMLAGLYASNGQPAEAEEQTRKLIALKPRELALRTQLALLLVHDHQLDAAQHVLEEAVKEFAKDPDRARKDAAKLTLIDFIATERSRAEGEKTLRGFIAQEPDNPDLRFGLGALLQRAGALPEAIAAYQEIVNREGTGAQGLVARDRIAAIELAQGHLEQATQLVNAVLGKNSRDAAALTMRADMALQRKDPTSAIADLRAVLRDQPKSVSAQRTLARAYLQKGEPALAEEALRAAFAEAPNDATVRVELARVLGQTDRGAQAVTLLEETLQRAPDNVDARVALIEVNIAKHDLSAALAAATELKTQQPASAAGFYYSGLIAAQQKRFPAAHSDLERAAALRPDAVDILSLLARVEIAQGQPEAALARIQTVVRDNPRRPEFLDLLGALYLQQKDFVHASDAYEREAVLAPNSWQSYRNLATVRLAANDATGAIVKYETALKLAPDEPRLVIELASLYEKQGRVDDAIARYAALYEHNPASQLAANNLAMLLVTYKSDQPSLDRARDLTAAFATSNEGLLLDTNGWVHFKRREYRDAVAVLERALERTPDSKVILYHLGMTQLQLGNRDRALTNLESALAGPGSFSGSEEARTALASLKARSG